MVGVEFVVIAMEGLLRVYADVACGCPEQESLAKPSFFDSPTPSKPYISPLSQRTIVQSHYSRLSGGTLQGSSHYSSLDCAALNPGCLSVETSTISSTISPSHRKQYFGFATLISLDHRYTSQRQTYTQNESPEAYSTHFHPGTKRSTRR